MTEDRESFFADWHPHFTPPWLSRRIAAHVPLDFMGIIVDPACGAGNLLAAAALRTEARERRGNEIHFVGNDISKKAVRECEAMLSGLLPHGNFEIRRGDFLRMRPRLYDQRPAIVLMNPPFGGYGTLAPTRRTQIRSTLKMKGRFNLGHAFVTRAVRAYSPRMVVALLPSNWIYSRTTWFRDELSALEGQWDWEDVGDAAFRGVNVHLGILIWQHMAEREEKGTQSEIQSAILNSGFAVRQGVATGADAVFMKLAALRIPFGRRLLAVRGRDVARLSSPPIWIPPATWKQGDKERFTKSVPTRVARRLARRSCVRIGRRVVFQYHDPIPDWLVGSPKLILPEIVAGVVRVEFDERGTKVPLHSTIAVRVPSVSTGRSLLRFLNSPEAREMLVTNAPRLNGGAVRLQVGAVRDVVNRWLLGVGRKFCRARQTASDGAPRKVSRTNVIRSR